MKALKSKHGVRTYSLEKDSSTVIPADSFVTLSSGLAVVAVAASSALGYTRGGAGEGETEVLIDADVDVVYEGTGDAVFAKTQRGTEVDLVIEPAYLETGVVTETDADVWELITDGSFRISIDGTAYNVDGIDFDTDADMDDVAASIQTALQSATSGSETVTWDSTNSKFVISSVSATASSEISVLSTSTGTVGTDISGSDYLNGRNGSGTVFNYEQKVDVGASSTDVFKIQPTNDAGTVGSADGIRFQINKPLFAN